MDPLSFLTSIAVVLFLGVLVSALAYRAKIPDAFLLLLIGIGINQVQKTNLVLIQFPTSFITSLGILALAMIVFDSTSRIDLKRIDSLSNRTLRLILTFLVIILAVFSLATYALFGFDIGLCLVFAAIMAGTSPGVILPLLGEKRSRVIDTLKLESIFNTPFTVLVPFFIIDLMLDPTSQSLSNLLAAQIVPFLTMFVSGVGSGLLIAIVLFKIIRRWYSRIYSPLTVILAALLAYVLAEQLGGNGVLSVTTLGLFLGNVHFKEKINLLNLESVFARALYILIFVLVGYVITPDWSREFLLQGLGLFVVYIFLRFVAIQLSVFDEHTIREKLFMSLVAPKGIAESVVAIVLSPLAIEGITPMLDLVLLFVLYSLICSSLACWARKRFLDC